MEISILKNELRFLEENEEKIEERIQELIDQDYVYKEGMWLYYN